VRSHRLASGSEEDRQQPKDINEPASVTIFLLKMLSVLIFNVMLYGYGPRLNILR
jgi:hypothetical protein